MFTVETDSMAIMLKNTDVNSSKRMRTYFESLTPNKRQNSNEFEQEEKNYVLDAQEYIVKPHKHDVLCGRGHLSHNHDGNAYFRRLVKSYKMDYISSPKKQKKIYSKMIYEKIRKLNPPGRFLKFEATESKWKDIGEKKAIEKARQALREGAPDLINTLQEKKSAAESILLLKGKECYDTEESIESDTESQQSGFTASDTSLRSVAKINEIDSILHSMYSSTKLSFPPIDGYTINNYIDADTISRGEKDDKCVVTKQFSSNCMHSKINKYDFNTSALPGPRINPTRYF